MNTIARRSMGALSALVAGVALGAGLLTAHTAGAESPSSWVLYDDGCVYLTDGQSTYQAACPRSDGYLDFYVQDGYGQWVYELSGGLDVNGCTIAFDSVGGFASSCFPDAALGVIGGATASSTGNPGDVMLGDLNNHVIDNALQPICIEEVGGICYT